MSQWVVPIVLVWVILTSLVSCDSNDNDSTVDDVHDDDVMDPDDDLPCSEEESMGEVWTDPESNLTWQTGSSCERRSYESAAQYCAELDLGDREDWRVPTISELRTLIRGCYKTITGGECPVTDECYDYSTCYTTACRGCQPTGSSRCNSFGPPAELEPVCSWLWSATPLSDAAPYTWCVTYESGAIVSSDIGDDGEGGNGYPVRCVRTPTGG